MMAEASVLLMIELARFGLVLYRPLGADEAKVIRLTYRILFFTMPRHDRQLSG